MSKNSEVKVTFPTLIHGILGFGYFYIVFKAVGTLGFLVF
jgi:hypothetical protein